MKIYKWTIYSMFVFCIISLGLAIFFDFINNSDFDFWVNLCLGTFCSGLLIFISSIVGYFVEKKKALIIYYICIRNIIMKLYNLKYFHTNEPKELILKYYIEKDCNKFKEKKQTQELNRLIKYYRNEYKLEDKLKRLNNEKYEEFAKDKLKKQIEEYDNELEKILDSYISISNLDYSEADSGYGNLDFLFNNFKLRKWIHKDIHEKIRELLYFVRDKAVHFEYQKDKETSNKALLLTLLYELQEEIFEKKEEIKDKYKYITVKNILADSLHENAEKLRCKIYKQKYLIPDSINILTSINLIK